LNAGRLTVRHWWAPVRELRKEQGLNPHCDPVFRDKFSPHLVLALFSSRLANPQPDWPAQTVQPGFIWFDRQSHNPGLDTHLADFLAAGEPPIVFTQGSTAVHNPGNFFSVGSRAATILNRRAVLVGAEPASDLISSRILAVPYAPYSQVFPHAAVIVHQGGSGTTGQALRAGRPQLIVPYGWDQPDNAARIQRLGAGLHVPRTAWSPATATTAVQQLLSDDQYSARAAQVGTDVQAETGLTSACDAIESILRP
jgi:UDP:flavonoid glycosyltransferase YjiC (YdhE family)